MATNHGGPMTPHADLEREIEFLRTALASANARIQAARGEARRTVMEHATYHPETRTYTISEQTLAHWRLL